MTLRSAPRGGYGFAEKQAYRESVWSVFRQTMTVMPRQAHALLMPSSEGIEIGVALKAGFMEEHLHIVDRNPAIVATLKRRFPKINTYGVDLGRACYRIADSGVRLSVANLDFTSCVSRSLMSCLREAFTSGAFDDRTVCGFTVLRGRERAGMSKVFQASDTLIGTTDFWSRLRALNKGDREATNTDAWRVQLTLACCLGYMFKPRRVGIYLSPEAKQTMLWWVCDGFSMTELKRINERSARQVDGAVACVEHALGAMRHPSRAMHGSRARSWLRAADEIGRHSGYAVGAGQTLSELATVWEVAQDDGAA